MDGAINVKWSTRFLALAEHVAGWSKDPSTQVGSVIVDFDRIIRGIGYNGFPRGVEDSEDRLQHRDTKLQFTVHAEANALLYAPHVPPESTIYTWPCMPCAHCAGLIIQRRTIRRVVAPRSVDKRWEVSFSAASVMFREAGVELCLVDP